MVNQALQPKASRSLQLISKVSMYLYNSRWSHTSSPKFPTLMIITQLLMLKWRLQRSHSLQDWANESMYMNKQMKAQDDLYEEV